MPTSIGSIQSTTQQQKEQKNLIFSKKQINVE